MARQGSFEVVVDGREVPEVLLDLTPCGGGDVLRLHLAQGHPVDVLHAALAERGDRGVDRPVEALRVPERIVVAGGDHDVIAGAEQVRLDVAAREIADEHRRLADDRDVPVGGEEVLQHATRAESDRVGHQHHPLVGWCDRTDTLGRSRRHGDDHGTRERDRRDRDSADGSAARAGSVHATHQPVVSKSVWPVDEVRKQSRPVSLVPRVIEFATTAPAAALADEVGVMPAQASAVT